MRVRKDRGVHPNKQEEIMNKLNYPLDIQLFAEGGDDATGTQPTTVTTPPIDYEKLAEVVSRRSSGTEEKVLQGYFKDQRLNPEQAKEAINQYKQAQIIKQQQEAEALQKIKEENEQLKAKMLNADIDKKVAELAGTLGVQSEKVPFLNKLIDRTNAAKEDGTLQDDNIKAAIEEVLKAFPDFKSTTQQQKQGFKIGADGNQQPQQTGNVSLKDAIAARLGK